MPFWVACWPQGPQPPKHPSATCPQPHCPSGHGELWGHAQLSSAVPYGVSCHHCPKADFENSDMFHEKDSRFRHLLYLDMAKTEITTLHLVTEEVKNPVQEVRSKVSYLCKREMYNEYNRCTKKETASLYRTFLDGNRYRALVVIFSFCSVICFGDSM